MLSCSPLSRGKYPQLASLVLCTVRENQASLPFPRPTNEVMSTRSVLCYLPIKTQVGIENAIALTFTLDVAPLTIQPERIVSSFCDTY